MYVSNGTVFRTTILFLHVCMWNKGQRPVHTILLAENARREKNKLKPLVIQRGLNVNLSVHQLEIRVHNWNNLSRERTDASLSLAFACGHVHKFGLGSNRNATYTK